jgi:hypothetical protein
MSNISDSPYLALDVTSESQSLLTVSLRNPVEKPSISFFAPFRNASTYRLMSWFYNSSTTKSLGELNSLVKDVILAPDFKSEELTNFNASKENAVMDSFRETGDATDDPSPFAFDDTWIKGKVEIPLPCDGYSFKSEADAPKFTVEFYYRKLIEVIKSALAEPGAERFHIFPFKAFWADFAEERIYSEIYTGDYWNDIYDKLQSRH